MEGKDCGFGTDEPTPDCALPRLVCLVGFAISDPQFQVPMSSPISGTGADQLQGAAERGVASIEEAARWLQMRGIEDVECITPDIAGVARGKMMPST